MEVELIDWMGTDLTVVNAARVSFDKISDWVSTPEADELRSSDTKLIKYLAKHDHWSPFAHTSVQLHVKAPIFIARQLGKHQVGLVWNEVSRRYVDSEPEFYTPDRWRMAAENVKQGSSNVEMVINTAFRQLNAASKNTRRSPCTAKFANWKSRAKREGTVFTITPSDIPWTLKCPILGVELDWSLGHGEGIKKNSPTLDRIDNLQGYIPGNVMVISSLANTMKSYASADEIIAFSRSMLTQYAGEFTSQTPSVSAYYAEMVDLYRRLIASGMCAEQARMFMPQSMMTEWYWTGSLFAFARVVNLRSAPHAQKECRDIAKMIHMHIKELFPVSTEALCPPY